MQALQPMHTRGSTSTIPSARFESAVTGQIVTQGAFVHWLQRKTAKDRRTSGTSPCSTYLTQVRKLPTGTSFSDLQATVQAWQPMHREWSMTNPSCNGAPVGGAGARILSRAECAGNFRRRGGVARE